MSEYNELQEGDQVRPSAKSNNNVELAQVYDQIKPGRDVLRGSERQDVLHQGRKSDIERISAMDSQKGRSNIADRLKDKAARMQNGSNPTRSSQRSKDLKYYLNDEQQYASQEFKDLNPLKDTMETYTSEIPRIRTIKFNNFNFVMRGGQATNKVVSGRYTVGNFLPVTFFNHFKHFHNFLYLAVALSQLYPPLKVGFLNTYLLPLGLAIFLWLFRELSEDINRHHADNPVNTRMYKELNIHTGEISPIQCDNIRVGDIIWLRQGERCPADMVLLYSSSDQAHLKSDDVDGQTDRKVRKPITMTQRVLRQYSDIKRFINAEIKCEDQSITPVNTLDEFHGIFAFPGGMGSYDPELNRDITEELTVENTMWHNMTLQSQGFVLGMVIFVGKETRSQLTKGRGLYRGTASGNNTVEQLRTILNPKISIIEKEISRLVLCTLIVLIMGCTTLTIFNGDHDGYYIYFFRNLMINLSFIPLSLRIGNDLIKMYYSYQISQDPAINGAVPRQSSHIEEMGRLDYIVTDKTGTITQNKMKLRKINFESGTLEVSYDGQCEFSQTLVENCEANAQGPCNDADQNGGPERDLGNNIRDIVTAFAICNDVIPIYKHDKSIHKLGRVDEHLSKSQVDRDPEQQQLKGRGTFQPGATNFNQFSKVNFDQENVNEMRVTVQPVYFQSQIDPKYLQADEDKRQKLLASSQDEICLVDFIGAHKFDLLQRDKDFIQVRNCSGAPESYEIIASFPFSSLARKQSILVQHRESQKLIYYCKGAELVMESRILESQKEKVLQDCEEMAIEGLRTLVFAQKVVEQAEVDEFMTSIDEAMQCQFLEERNQMIQAAQDVIEKDMNFLGISGIEEQLQDRVPETINNLKDSGIKIWMASGDRIENGASIALSSGIKSPSQELYFIANLVNKTDILFRISQFHKLAKNCMLIIDGRTMDVILDSQELVFQFFKAALKAPSVCLCRATPTQKTELVRLLKIYSNGKKIGAVGDGGNDVGMMNEADLAISIAKSTSVTAAAISSEVSITSFGHLDQCILGYGQASYQAAAKVTQFILIRGLTIAVIQAKFTMFFHFVAVPIFNQMLYLTLVTVFLCIPVFMILFEVSIQDSDDKLEQVKIYLQSRKGRQLNHKKFLELLMISIYQGSVIIMVSAFLFDESFANIVLTSFCAFITSEQIRLVKNFSNIDYRICGTLFVLCIGYFLTVSLMNNYFKTGYVDMEFVSAQLLIQIIIFTPELMFNACLRQCDPNKKFEERQQSLESGLQ